MKNSSGKHRKKRNPQESFFLLFLSPKNKFLSNRNRQPSTSLAYIYAPQIHTNLRGRFRDFVGKDSKKLDKFSCVHIDSSGFGIFPVIASKSNTDNGIPAQTSVIPLYSDTLAGTRWAPSSDKLTGALYPNFFIFYFDQAVPQGNISSDNIKSKFAKLGKGYDNWITAAIVALETKEDIAYALHNASNKDGYKEQDFFARHFHPKYDKKELGPIVLGPFGFIASVDSDCFKVEAELICNLYLPSAPSPNPVFTQVHLNTLTLQLPGNIEKEAEATKGITKLLLLHIRGVVSRNYDTFSDLSSAKPAQGMNVVLALPCTTQATTFSDLIRVTCRLAIEHDFMSLRSRLVSIVFFNKSAATHFLAGNLAVAEATTLNNEANSINLFVFLPQRNALMVNKERVTALA